MNSTTVRQAKEKAVLVGVELKRSWPLMDVDDSLEELGRLADTAGVKVVGRITQRVDRFDPATYIGSGKVEEVHLLVAELEADLVIFDDELSPRHQRELERIFGEDVRLLDRTALILDIFAQHAQTREGQLQVELAQLEYRLPRLTRMWTHLARQAGGRAGGSGGGVGLRGPGETQLESDRRMIGQRISQLKTELEKVRAHRGRHRDRRQRNEVPVVAIVGYTNAGKSTLLNRLSGAQVLAADQLFATLDPTTRRVTLPGGHEVLCTDTVGFIQKLPTMLVAAFRATLEEIAEADTLLHVVDATHPQAAAQMESVQDTLAELQVDTLPIVLALNKVDRLSDPDRAIELIPDEQIGFPVSALTGYGLEPLLNAVEETLVRSWVQIDAVIPYQEGALVSLFHQEGTINQQTHTAEGVHIVGRIPVRLAHRYDAWRTPTPVGRIRKE
jgi:GTP-binding protein HflX